MNNDLENIINMEHHEPNKKHSRMSIYNRSAQFASFKALKEYDNEINRNGIMIEKKIELESDEKELLDNKISKIKNGDVIFIKYYNNGKYIEENIIVKRIDCIKKEIIASTNKYIKIDSVVIIENL